MKRLTGFLLPLLGMATAAIAAPKVFQLYHVAKNDKTIIRTEMGVTNADGYFVGRRFLGTPPAFQYTSTWDTAGPIVISAPWGMDRCRKACAEFSGCVAYDLIPGSPGQETGPGQHARICSVYTKVPPSLSGMVRDYKDTRDIPCFDLGDTQVCAAARLKTGR